MSKSAEQVQWQQTTVSSTHLPQPIPVIAAKDVPYFAGANRLENLNIYVPVTDSTSKLIGTPATSLPASDTKSTLPNTLVHIHGGAWYVGLSSINTLSHLRKTQNWTESDEAPLIVGLYEILLLTHSISQPARRDPNLTASSIEATVAHAFAGNDKQSPISVVVALNYDISPTQHPMFHPYDPEKEHHSDIAREAIHPSHVRDVLSGFSLLRSFGLTDDSYILTGHSAGVCLGCQAVLQPPSYYGFQDTPSPPRPAALIGCNGLYDLEQLVHGLGPSHVQLKDDYNAFLSIAFGKDQSKWPLASPARFDVDDIAKRVEQGEAPKLVLLDQSTEDQLVPLNQRERMIIQLEQVPGMKVVRGHRCTGVHAAPWWEGYMIWENVLDVIQLLREQQG